MRKLSISGDHFILDEQPIRLLSGALHYFRIVPEYWQDRLLKLQACGLNTVETYIPWNLHEPEEGTSILMDLLTSRLSLDLLESLVCT